MKTSPEADKVTQNRVDNLRSIPGVGPVLSALLIAEMPDLARYLTHKLRHLQGLHRLQETAETCVQNVQSVAGEGTYVTFCFRRRLWRLSTILFCPVLRAFANRTKSS